MQTKTLKWKEKIILYFKKKQKTSYFLNCYELDFSSKIVILVWNVSENFSILIYCQIYDFFDPSTFFDDTRKLVKTVVINFFDQNTMFSKIQENNYLWKWSTSWGTSSWGKCHLGEGPVGGSASFGMCQLRELNLSDIPSTIFNLTHLYLINSPNQDYVFSMIFLYILINSYKRLRVIKWGPSIFNLWAIKG